MLTGKSKIIKKTFLYYLFVLAFSFLILRINWMLTLSKIIEAALSLVLILCFVSQKPVRDYLSKVPVLHLRLFLVFFFLFSSAHFIEKEKATFPFLTWGMYGKSYVQSHIIFYDYVGVQSNGKRVRIIPEKVYPIMMHSRLNKKLEYLFKMTIAPEIDPALQNREEPASLFKKLSRGISSFFAMKPIVPGQAVEMLDALLLAIGDRYNETHKNSPIVTIEMVLNKRELIFTSKSELKKEVVRRVNMGEN